MKKPRNHEQTLLRLAQKGLLRARELKEQAVPTIALTRLVTAGKLERLGRGVYALPGADVSTFRSLAEAAIRVPRGVICLLSALRVHNIGTQSPFQVWLAIPHRMVPPKVEQVALRIVRMSGAPLTEGIQHITIDGVSVPVYDAAKTVVDCFKYRNKIGLDVALEALRESWRARKVTMDNLWRYAKICRVANVMRPYLEAVA